MKLKDEKEWIAQAEYDIKAARKNFEAGLYPYAIFFCHLSIEKALKAVYVFKIKKEPPKIHDLTRLAAIINLQGPGESLEFIDKMSAVSIPARYPEELKRVLKGYTKKQTELMVEESRKVVRWLKKQLT